MNSKTVFIRRSIFSFTARVTNLELKNLLIELDIIGPKIDTVRYCYISELDMHIIQHGVVSVLHLDPQEPPQHPLHHVVHLLPHQLPDDLPGDVDAEASHHFNTKRIF